MHKDDVGLCRIFFKDCNRTDSVYIYELMGQDNKGEYKGARSELLKLAVAYSFLF